MAYSIPTPSDTQSDWSSGCSNSGSFSDSIISPMFENDNMDSSPIPTTLVAPSPHQFHNDSISVTMATGSAQEGKFKPGNTRQGQFAREDDWVRHQKRITSLYEKRSLKEVIAIMVKEHNFHATERMYKARFKDWGVKKNVTAAEVHKLTQEVERLQQRAGPYQTISSGEKDRVVVNVGCKNVRRIQKYIKRKPKGLEVLRRDPHRPLDVLKALSVDDGDRAAEVSIATAELEERGQAYESTLPSPPLDSFSPWSPGPQLSIHATQQHYATQQHPFVMDSGFGGANANVYLPSPSFTPSLPPQWQNHDHGHDHGKLLGSTTPTLVHTGHHVASVPAVVQTSLPLADLSLSPGVFDGYEDNFGWQQVPDQSSCNYWLSGLARPPPMGSSFGNTFGMMYSNANAY